MHISHRYFKSTVSLSSERYLNLRRSLINKHGIVLAYTNLLGILKLVLDMGIIDFCTFSGSFRQIYRAFMYVVSKAFWRVRVSCLAFAFTNLGTSKNKIKKY